MAAFKSSIQKFSVLAIAFNVVGILRCIPSPSKHLNYVTTDLIEAAKRDPRYLPILPTLFAVPDGGTTPSGTNPVVTMFYNLLDLENMYPPSLRHCKSIGLPNPSSD